MKKHSIFSNKIGYIYNSLINNYFSKVPFDPPEKYQELSFISRVERSNEVYPMLRELLQKMELDKKHIGTSKWNPFKDIINPGDNVLIKPNLVTNYHYWKKEAVVSTIVHGSIIRPIIDYVYLALEGTGSIIIGDTPIEPADFDEIMAITGIRKMVDVLAATGYRNMRIIDLRPVVACEERDGELVKKISSGDPLGYATIDLGKDSFFSEFDSNQNVHYYTLEDRTIDHLDPKECKRSVTDDYHNSSAHRYMISKTVLNADVIIDVAKLKTHCKAGVTLTMKNLIGIVGTKACMPHHRPGPPPVGDSFPNFPPFYHSQSRKFYRKLRKTLHVHRFPGVRPMINTLRKKKIVVGQHIDAGNWKGNDTIWRTILDINRIAFYADRNGIMQGSPQRKFFGIIDGIIGQQGDAPISGEPVQCGVIFAGLNLVVLDALATRVMGIDYKIIKTISEAGSINKWPLLQKNVDLTFEDIEAPNLNFILPRGWQ